MESQQTRLKQIVALLEAVVRGSLDPQTAIKRWQEIDQEATGISPETNKLLNKLWEQLYHYMNDEDIRDREPEYGESQRKRLSTRINDLKARLGKEKG